MRPIIVIAGEILSTCGAMVHTLSRAKITCVFNFLSVGLTPGVPYCGMFGFAHRTATVIKRAAFGMLLGSLGRSHYTRGGRRGYRAAVT